jgi:hypothetical protein
MPMRLAAALVAASLFVCPCGAQAHEPFTHHYTSVDECLKDISLDGIRPDLRQALCEVMSGAAAGPFTLDEAQTWFASAWLAQSRCPGVKLSDPKMAAWLATFSDQDAMAIMDNNALHEHSLRILIHPNLEAELCDDARDPKFPFHFLLDIAP